MKKTFKKFDKLTKKAHILFMKKKIIISVLGVSIAIAVVVDYLTGFPAKSTPPGRVWPLPGAPGYPLAALEKTEYVSREEVQNFWIKMMNEKNPELHDALISAMLLSKDTGKEIFVLHNSKTNSLSNSNKLKYRLSTQRGTEDNILSFTYDTKYISFDHFRASDGPSLEESYNKIIIQRKINAYYSELNIK